MHRSHLRQLAWVVVRLATVALVACGPTAPAPPASTPQAQSQPPPQSGATSPPAAPAAAAATTAPAPSTGKQALDGLIARAKQEGELDTATLTEAAGAVPKLVDAFNKRFGLNLKINVAIGDQQGKYSQLFAQLQAGLPPTYDTLTGSEEDNGRLIEENWAIKIDNWEAVLAEINPQVASGRVKPDVVSPAPFTGYAFVWSTRDKSLLYNTSVISAADLPQTYADLANPKYAGKYPLASFTDQWELGTLVYKDKQEWLRIVNDIGKNAASVLNFSPALDRILLGEFAFQPSNTYYYYQVRARDPQAPIGQEYFKDFIPATKVVYVVPQGSRHPAAATLWSMWIGTPEAEAIWQPVAFAPNTLFGESQIDEDNRQRIESSGGRVVTYYDDAEGMAQLKWFATPEGRAYREQLTRALTQRGQ
jgi:ABC-type Fe3+ transport system substrate-binding protein